MSDNFDLQALDDVTVIDMAPMLPGHFCSMILADLGARVIKVERPVTGDYSRHSGVPGSFESVNRNKEGMTLDLKSTLGQEVLHRLVAQSDVIIEGFRPGVSQRLRSDYPTLREINAALIYCSISGYGQSGPYRDLPGHDPNYLSYAGILSLAGEPDGPPTSNVGVSMADLSAAWFSAIAVIAALRARDRHGVGQFIDVALSDSAYALVQNRMTEYLVKGGVDKSTLMSRPGIGLFPTKDNLFLTVAAIEQHFWEPLCEMIEAFDWLEDPSLRTVLQRRAQSERIRSRLENSFLSRTRAEWLQLLRSRGIPCAPVNDLGEAAHDENAVARHVIEYVAHPTYGNLPTVRFPPLLSETPATIRKRPPLLGEHTDEILHELEYSSVVIQQLHVEGVV
jgi:formyl-CoA transferase